MEVLGIMLPPVVDPPVEFPTAPTSSMDASDPAGMKSQRTQRREDLDASTLAAGDAPYDPTLEMEGRIPQVQGPALVQRLQLVTITRLCQERDPLCRRLAEARAALPATVFAEKDHLERLEACAAQLGRECKLLRQEGEVLRKRRERWEATMVAQATLIALMQTM